MARYLDTVTDERTGAAMPGVSVYVYHQSGGTVTLTADGGGALGNPLTTDSMGGYAFNAPDGLYVLDYRYGGRRLFVKQGVQVGTGPTLPAEIVSALGTGAGAEKIGQALFGSPAIIGLDKFMQQFGCFPEAFDSGIETHQGDNTYNMGPALQAAFNYSALNSTKCILRPGRVYYTHQQLRLKSGAHIDGQVETFQGPKAAILAMGSSFTQGNGNYLMVGDGTNYAADHVVLRGLYISPNSANSSNVFGGVVVNGNSNEMWGCYLQWFGLEAAIYGGGNSIIEHSYLQGLSTPATCYAGTDPFDPTGDGSRGVLTVYGGDGRVADCELSGGAGNHISNAQMLLAAFKCRGSTMLIQGNRFQTGECGQRDFGTLNRYIGNSWDTNAGHGCLLINCGNNVFTGNFWGGNSADTSGGARLYDHIHSDGPAAYNTFIGSQFYSGGGFNTTARYDIYDTRNNGGMLSNSYLDSYHSVGSVAAINPTFGGHYRPRTTDGMGLSGAGNGKSLLGAKLVGFGNTSATSYAWFIDVTSGQDITFIGDGFTTLTNAGGGPAGSSSLNLGRRGSLLMKAGYYYRFVALNSSKQLTLLSASTNTGLPYDYT